MEALVTSMRRPDAPAATGHEVEPLEAKGDGETWEAYAHRLEHRIKQQRDHISALVALREPGDIKARTRIAALERALGRMALTLSREVENREALVARLGEGSS